MSEVLLMQREDAVCTLTLNRPERKNALTPELLERLSGALQALAQDETVRAVVLRGAGQEAFCSGFDLSGMPETIDGDSGAPAAAQRLVEALEAVASCPQPVIAALCGATVGAGCELAAACDLRIAGDNTRLGMPPAKLGLIYSAKGHRRFIDLVGLANTKELFLTGRLVGAGRALAMGLVNDVVSAEGLFPAVYDLAREIAGNAPFSVRGTKMIINRMAGCRTLSAEERDAFDRMVQVAFESEDAREAQAAFREKRKPVFRGR